MIYRANFRFRFIDSGQATPRRKFWQPFAQVVQQKILLHEKRIAILQGIERTVELIGFTNFHTSQVRSMLGCCLYCSGPIVPGTDIAGVAKIGQTTRLPS